MLSVLMGALAQPAVTNLILALVGSVASVVVVRVGEVLRTRYNVDIDAKTNAALIDGINRMAAALLAKGVPAGMAVDTIVREIIANRPDTVKRFGLDDAKGGAKLRGIVDNQLTLTQVREHASNAAGVAPVPVASVQV